MPLHKRSEDEISKITQLVRKDQKDGLLTEEDAEKYLKLADENQAVLADIGTGDFDTYLSLDDVQGWLEEEGADPKRRVKLYDAELIDDVGNEITLEELAKVMQGMRVARTTDKGPAKEKATQPKVPLETPKGVPIPESLPEAHADLPKGRVGPPSKRLNQLYSDLRKMPRLLQGEVKARETAEIKPTKPLLGRGRRRKPARRAAHPSDVEVVERVPTVPTGAKLKGPELATPKHKPTKAEEQAAALRKAQEQAYENAIREAQERKRRDNLENRKGLSPKQKVSQKKGISKGGWAGLLTGGGIGGLVTGAGGTALFLGKTVDTGAFISFLF